MFFRFLKLLYFVPILGRLIREALEGPDEALLAFLANVVMAIALAVIIFGFPALITIALCAVLMMFVIIFDITQGKV